jgi:hypothetical protein
MLGKIFVLSGLALLIIGGVMLYAPGLLGWFGRLPGDIRIEREGTQIFIPITSMIILSLVLSIVVNFFFRR